MRSHGLPARSRIAVSQIEGQAAMGVCGLCVVFGSERADRLDALEYRHGALRLVQRRGVLRVAFRAFDARSLPTIAGARSHRSATQSDGGSVAEIRARARAARQRSSQCRPRKTKYPGRCRNSCAGDYLTKNSS